MTCNYFQNRKGAALGKCAGLIRQSFKTICPSLEKSAKRMKAGFCIVAWDIPFEVGRALSKTNK